MTNDERLQILLGYQGTIEREVISGAIATQHKRIVDDLDAMAEVLDFEINWSHDSRELEDIIAAELEQLVESRKAEIISNCRRVLLEKIRSLRVLKAHEDKVWKALRGD